MAAATATVYGNGTANGNGKTAKEEWQQNGGNRA